MKRYELYCRDPHDDGVESDPIRRQYSDGEYVLYADAIADKEAAVAELNHDLKRACEEGAAALHECDSLRAQLAQARAERDKDAADAKRWPKGA